MYFFFQLNRKTVGKAYPRKIIWRNQSHRAGHRYKSLVQKSIFTRDRMLPNFRQSILDWITKNVRPSSNTKHLIKYKQKGQVQRQVIHWRDSSIRTLFYRCRAEVPNGHLLFQSYFYGTIPKYVKLSKPKDGLCPTHLSAYHLKNELKRLRKK